MRSDYFGLISDIGDLEGQMAKLEILVDEMEGEIRELKNNP